MRQLINQIQIMKFLLFFCLMTINYGCGQIQTQSSQENFSNLVVIKDFNSTKHGYGQNVVAEIENKSDKNVSFVSVEFTWYDKNGKLITSQKGNTSNINSHSTGIVDSYFDEMPEESTYKAKINEVIF